MSPRTYDKEFKLNAIELHKNGKKAAQLCRDLGVPESTFDGWLKQYNRDGEQSFPGSGNIKEADKEVAQLRKELADAQLERDILKKALAIFSRQK